MTMAIEVGGVIMDIVAHLIAPMFTSGGGIAIFWGIWIPLCFITIPPIHYLCRSVQELQIRIETLESQTGNKSLE